MNQLISFLQASAHMVGQTNARLCGYAGMQDFVLKHGREFTPGTICWALGKQNCFQHAAEAASLCRDFTYCEGYAAGIIPVLHAWIVDAKDGTVIETTWPEMGTHYYGIPFRTDYVRNQIKLTKHYSMIDQWENDWPTIRAPKEQWLRKLLPNESVRPSELRRDLP
jgi:hypothetical protein